MKVPLSWLQEFAPIDGEPEQLAAELTDLGLVVEEVFKVGGSLTGVVVAEVLELGSHPKADRIQLVQVDIGDGEPLQVCCGAFNMSVGDLVPFATIGTVMASGMKIGRRKLRGEWSNGMLCSAAELELPETKGVDGIMVLDPNYTVGQPLADALALQSDVVFDIDVEGNRPDALSIVGVARDLAARLGVSFTLPEPTVTEQGSPASDASSVTIDSPDLCARFGVRVLRNVTVGDSPLWMQQRLFAAGMRPINSIVDISNYVMLEQGCPNHTYDLDRVADGALGVRWARPAETLTTLDHTKRELTDSDGVITNKAGEAIGLAGVMGGASTEINTTTTNVLLEAAIWDRLSIAWTARRQNLRSEASTRFERGVDPYALERALDRFCELAVEHCSATVARGRVFAEGNLNKAIQVDVRVDRVNLILNTQLSAAEIVATLSPIGFACETIEAGVLSVMIPTWRPDASIEEDVIEEIGRHIGYSASGKRVPTPTQSGELTTNQRNRRRIHQAMLAGGFSEAMPLPFVAPEDLERIGSPRAITITYPLVANESVLRPSMLPGLLKAVAYNQSHQQPAVHLYELGNVFVPTGAELPDEPERLAAIASGFTPENKAAEHAVRSVYAIADRLGINGLSVRNAKVSGLHPNRSAEVILGGKIIGYVGEVDLDLTETYAIESRLAWLDLDAVSLLEAIAVAPRYTPVSRFPASDIDLAFVTPVTVSAIDLARVIKKAGGGLIGKVELFDVFRSSQLGPDVRSLAYKLRLQARDRTLTDTEVADVRTACVEAAEQLGAELR